MHGDVTPVESEFCNIFLSPQHISPVLLNCKQHSLLKKHILGPNSTFVLIQTG